MYDKPASCSVKINQDSSRLTKYLQEFLGSCYSNVLKHGKIDHEFVAVDYCIKIWQYTSWFSVISIEPNYKSHLDVNTAIPMN